MLQEESKMLEFLYRGLFLLGQFHAICPVTPQNEQPEFEF